MEHKILSRFLLIEGLDGSGTTTQMKLLQDRFDAAGIKAVSTFEPTDYPSGRLIRSILKGEADVHPETLARLFSADRNEHLFNTESGINTYLEKNYRVICDRYLFSSLAYQSLHCDFETVFDLNSHFPLPEHLFFIDTSINECQNRIGKRDNRELFEYEHQQNMIRNNYLKGIAKYEESGMKVHYVNGDQTAEKIHNDIWNILSSAEK